MYRIICDSSLCTEIEFRMVSIQLKFDHEIVEYLVLGSRMLARVVCRVYTNEDHKNYFNI